LQRRAAGWSRAMKDSMVESEAERWWARAQKFVGRTHMKGNGRLRCAFNFVSDGPTLLMM
jgi:hypothetical protein